MASGMAAYQKLTQKRSGAEAYQRLMGTQQPPLTREFPARDYQQPPVIDATKTNPDYLSNPVPYPFGPGPLGGLTEKASAALGLERKPGDFGGNLVKGVHSLALLPLQAAEDPIGMVTGIPRFIWEGVKNTVEGTALGKAVPGMVSPEQEMAAREHIAQYPVETALGAAAPVSMVRGAVRGKPSAQAILEKTEKSKPALESQPVVAQEPTVEIPKTRNVADEISPPGAVREPLAPQTAPETLGNRDISPPPAAKEPWEMTRGEFADEWTDRSGFIKQPDGTYTSLNNNGQPRPDKLSTGWAKRMWDEHAGNHKRLVEDALTEGKPVPPEVLADYPDLKKGAVAPETEPPNIFDNPRYNLMQKHSQSESGMLVFENKKDLLDAFAQKWADQQLRENTDAYFQLDYADLVKEGMERGRTLLIYNPGVSNGGFFIKGFGHETSRWTNIPNIPHLAPQDWLKPFRRSKPKAPAVVETAKPPAPEAAPEAAGTKPPAEIPAPEKPVAAGDAELIGLKRAETDKLRQELELEPAPPVRRKAFEEAANEANERGLKGKALEIADEVRGGDRTLSDAEFVGLAQKASDLSREYDAALATVDDLKAAGNESAAAMERARAESIRANYEKIIEASELSGTEQSRNFSIRRMLMNRESYELVDVVREARIAKGSPLTPQETVRFEALANEVKAKQLALDQMTAKWEAEQTARLKSEAELQAKREIRRATISRKAAGQRERIYAERQDIKKQLQSLGYRANEVTGVSAEASYLVGRLAVNYIKEGAVTLNEVVQKVLADLPDLTERDVYNALNARNPKRQAALKSQTQQRIARLKSQARLITELEQAEQGVFKPTKARPPQPQELEQLRSKLRKLRDAAYKEGNADMQAARLEKTLRRINEAQDQLDNLYRAVREKKTLPSEDVAAAQQKLAEIRRLMSTQDKIADLTEQLRTGEFKETAKTKNPIPPELEKAQIDLKRARSAVRQAQDEIRPWTTTRRITESLSTLRAMKATADLSGTLRQGLVLVSSDLVRNPARLARNFGNSLRATFSKFKADQIDNALRQRPTNYLSDLSGLKLSELDGMINAREEMFSGRFIEKIPGIGHVIKASNRHMTTFLNLVRTSAFDDFVKKFPNATRDELKAYADFINVATGKGNIPLGAKPMTVLNATFFAPRFAVSRFQTPYKLVQYWKSPRVRKAIAKDMASTVALGTSVLALAKLGGAEVGNDPRNSDFGKIRVGDTRIDLWGGFQQPARLIARIGVSATDNYGLTGKDLSKFEKTVDPLDLVSRFAAYKLSPALTLGYELATRKNVIGQPVGVGEIAANTFLPMVFQDIADAYKAENALHPAAVTGLTMFGVGASTYEPSEADTRKKIKQLRGEGKKQEADNLQRRWNEKHPDKESKISRVEDEK